MTINEAPSLSALRAVTRQPNFAGLLAASKPDNNGYSPDARLTICGALLWSGFQSPEAIVNVYDTIAQGVLELESTSLPDADYNASSLSDKFWEDFDTTLSGPENGYDPVSITAAIAALGGSVDPYFHELAETAACNHAGAKDVTNKEIPSLLTLSELENCEPGSLGNSLYRMLVDNGYDPEVLDRDAIGLSQLSPAQRYLNTRILQMHDVWHLVAGYKTTSLHEIAISGFQLAQFNHGYSAMFLASIACISHLRGSEGFSLLLRTISEAWVHGRSTPALMAIEFEEEWNEPLETIRNRHEIKPFAGTFPADLFEQLSAQST